ncbi:MAG: hypothetical protein ACK515_08190 [bacterium]|jgi:hypothetical protein|nr:hypothetical protein [Betaproteobacteria bacterium]
MSRLRGGVWSSAWRGIRLGALLRWALLPPGRPMPEGGRVLLLYDFSHQPVSVGDLLVARVAAQALLALHGARHADMAFLHEPRPAADASTIDGASGITQVGHALQALRLDPELGSVFFFSERLALEAFVDRSPAGQVVWPPAGYYAAGQYVYYLVWNELLHEHFSRFGGVPQLRAAIPAAAWAAAFIAGKAAGRLPISIQLRRNPLNPVRDSDFDAWFAFLSRCAAEAPQACFFLVGSGAEEDARIAGLANVVVAKAFHTTLEQDLAVIGACRAHMGASSGPSTMAFFSDRPYALFGWNSPEHRYRDLRSSGDARLFFFARDHQRLVVETETPALLMREFQRIVAALGAAAGSGATAVQAPSGVAVPAR